MVVKNQSKPYAELKEEQERTLRHMVQFAYTTTPYYHDLFRKLDLMPSDIRTLDDLIKLPVLSKDIIKKRWDDFKPSTLSSMKYDTRATGGTSGTPMQYRVEKDDRFLGAALLYRGWGYGGYELGDRMAFLAGSSLDVGKKSFLNKYAHERTRNVRKLSSFDMREEEMENYARLLSSFKPRYLRGYPSSIYYFVRWLEETGRSIPTPKAVFTTSEKLLPHMRKGIQDHFDCDVYDNYGLNDGGISAYECPEHNGLHIDTERSIIEVVVDDDTPLNSGEGRILATSLHNHAMPFIRYACGDEGSITTARCRWGREHVILKEVMGRTTDMLITPEGRSVHGWFFLYIFWEYGKGIKEYQVVQKTLQKIVVKIVPEDGFNDNVLNDIRRVVSERSTGWELDFRMVEKIERTSAGKFKYIINEVKDL